MTDKVAKLTKYKDQTNTMPNAKHSRSTEKAYCYGHAFLDRTDDRDPRTADDRAECCRHYLWLLFVGGGSVAELRAAEAIICGWWK